MLDHKLFQQKLDQKRKPFGKRFDRKPWCGVITTLFPKCLTANLFKKKFDQKQRNVWI
jgi:hypothetical protein